jgi:hypothetical protein
MMKNLTAIMASCLKRDAKEDKKKSMLSHLAPEATNLFELLSAWDWDNSDPRMNPFVQELLPDKDAQQALGVMQTQTKRWSGEISDKRLLASFPSGYAASDIQESPGGFTIFMFRPITARVPSNRKDRRQQVKVMFGNAELDKEAIKYYAESDFFLPEMLADLKEQIYTCIKALELFTMREGIAVEGFIHGMKMVQRDRRLFKNFLATDPFFAVKFAYLLNRVFQTFLDELGNYYQDRKPIRKARKRLANSQQKAIERAMIGYKVCAIPRLFLPSSLRGEGTQEQNHHDSVSGGKPKARAGSEKTPTPAWGTRTQTQYKHGASQKGKPTPISLTHEPLKESQHDRLAQVATPQEPEQGKRTVPQVPV